MMQNEKETSKLTYLFLFYGFWQSQSSALPGLAYKGAELQRDKYPVITVSRADHEPVMERGWKPWEDHMFLVLIWKPGYRRTGWFLQRSAAGMPVVKPRPRLSDPHPRRSVSELQPQQNHFSMRARCSRYPEVLAACAVGVTSQSKRKHKGG